MKSHFIFRTVYLIERTEKGQSFGWPYGDYGILEKNLHGVKALIMCSGWENVPDGSCDAFGDRRGVGNPAPEDKWDGMRSAQTFWNRINWHLELREIKVMKIYQSDIWLGRFPPSFSGPLLCGDSADV